MRGGRQQGKLTTNKTGFILKSTLILPSDANVAVLSKSNNMIRAHVELTHRYIVSTLRPIISLDIVKVAPSLPEFSSKS